MLRGLPRPGFRDAALQTGLQPSHVFPGAHGHGELLHSLGPLGHLRRRDLHRDGERLRAHHLVLHQGQSFPLAVRAAADLSRHPRARDLLLPGCAGDVHAHHEEVAPRRVQDERVQPLDRAARDGGPAARCAAGEHEMERGRRGVRACVGARAGDGGIRRARRGGLHRRPRRADPRHRGCSRTGRVSGRPSYRPPDITVAQLASRRTARPCTREWVP
mmetsp:Transcript_65253/g.140991  ORF Transcript_65253/g.140991 Transcript_65253/m.140991 type:complete len:217 (+) Transcript_65253:689-1339(+)